MPYLPALRFPALSWAYEPVAIRIVRAREWRPAVADAVAPAAGERVLDLGCGNGNLCVRLKARCPEAAIVGVDPDPAMLARARARAHAAGLAPLFLAGDATALPRDPAGRFAFLVTQLFDGFATTRDHAGEAFPAMLAGAGRAPPPQSRGRRPARMTAAYQARASAS
jgi:SAM-dependent methyltransferase